ncbi:hypothetical protein GCM10011614_16520 [Novosphingobium colocasiae]|uniref:Uncharacterized protein n=1 Tax=Novosphingobium colocasiae TaxID=1256513 RepID=A0A918PEM0_9SPHN|nr:hypothetical protein GCM10011614_16520 [Novosphingobium colocasiae]
MPGQRARLGLEHGGQRAEALDQAAGQRFHVAAGNRLHQQHFYDLVIAQRLGPAFDQPLAQTATMAAGIVAVSRGGG